MNNSSIEWTDKTWNPVSGCSKVSAGCKNCYAEAMFTRFKKKWGDFNDVKCHEDKLLEPLRMRYSNKIFVNSMSDLFHEKVPFEFIDEVMAVIALAFYHTFQVLTKRPERMGEYLRSRNASSNKKILEAIENIPRELGHSNSRTGELALPLKNLWLGVSVEDQKTADERIPVLLEIPASLRFLSCEPLLGELDLNNYLYNRYHMGGPRHMYNQIDWVIAGGESGPNARPMHEDWIMKMLLQCHRAKVPFFFKQWGEWYPQHLLDSKTQMSHPYKRDKVTRMKNGDYAEAHWMVRMGKKKAGSLLCGVECKEFPVGD